MYTSSRSILWIVGFSFGSNSTWKDVTTSHSMSWLNQCTVGLSPSNNCIREFRSFAPIFLGNDCLRVRYLDISFTFGTYIWGRVEWRQWRLKSQEILLRAGERFCCTYLGRVECHMVLCQCFFYHSPLYSRCFITVLTMSSLGKNLSSPIFGVRSFLKQGWCDILLSTWLSIPGDVRDNDPIGPEEDVGSLAIVGEVLGSHWSRKWHICEMWLENYV